MRAGVHRFPLVDPGDVSGLAAAIEAGAVDPRRIVAVIGKTHGNGLVNDYTRGYLTLALAQLIASRTGALPDQVREKIPFVFSGGVEGVLSPHYVVFTVEPDVTAADDGKSLAVGVAFAAPLEPAEVGRQAQIDATAAAVADAVARTGIEDASDVHFVQVKGPAFTLTDIVGAAASGRPCASDDPGKLTAFGRAASALGVAEALGEVPQESATESRVLKDFGMYSSVASISAGVEVRTNEVIVLRLSRKWTGDLTIAHAPMKDALDIHAIVGLTRSLGFTSAPQVPEDEQHRLRAAFVKCEPQRDGLIRGQPHTMLNDGDINKQRRVRADVGAIVASVLNDTAIFVSGGAEHQDPDGGGLVAIIAERPGR